MTNGKYNAHTDPLFKSLKLLKNKDIFDVQCMKIWYKFVNNNVPAYFASIFRYNRELYDMQTRSHELLHLYPVRNSNARNTPRHRIPELLCKYPTVVLEKPALTALCHLLAMSNSTFWTLIALIVWSRGAIYVRG